jgi:hypothetical protein
MGGIINIVIGLVFIGGGLSGALALRGTNSGPLLAMIGVGLVIYGVYRLWKTAKS